MYTERTTCRICRTEELETILDLGMLVPSDFLTPDRPDPPRAPLDLVRCAHCGLVQLRHTMDPATLYRDAYWYRSGVNETMRAELLDVVHKGTRAPRKTILDIGCNDGTLLSYTDPEMHTIGVEPVYRMIPLAGEYADVIFNGFFPRATASLPAGQIDLITSIAMVYDVDEPLMFVEEIDRLLSPDGCWIVQMQDLQQMVDQTAFDNICHEHLCYYTPKTFSTLLEPFNLQIHEIEPRAINGGSLRFYIGRKTSDPNLVPSNRWEVTRTELLKFAWEFRQVREQVRGTVLRAQAHARAVDLYAASTKSSTLLQACGLDCHHLRCAVERSDEKFGLVTSGTRIPIISEEAWRKDPAEITLMGAWQFKDAFLKREHEYLKKQGAFIIPLPHPEVVYGA